MLTYFLRTVIVGAVLLGGTAPVFAIPLLEAESTHQPVSFLANTMTYDENAQRVTAQGAVEIIQNDRILTAQRVDYDLAADRVFASGDVALADTDGSVYFADRVELTDDMKEGAIEGFYAELSDGSRFWADKGSRSDGTKTTLSDARYTACKACPLAPEAKPVWQIKAGSIEHDKQRATVIYHDATFEMAGIPVAYTPYFSHPDGTIKQKSGFLAPSFGSNSDLGISVGTQYYWAIDPTQDVTLGVQAFSKQAPMLLGEWRREFDHASVILEGGVTSSDRPIRLKSGERERSDEEIRGHLFGEGVFEIDNQWRSGFELEATTDDQYLRQYDFSGKDVLENEMYVERFTARDYAVIRALAFQDVRISDRQRDQPNILPEIDVSFLGDPGQTFGGRWSLDANTLYLRRAGNGQDLSRLSADAGWERDVFTSLGTRSTISLDLRSDAFRVNDRTQNAVNPAVDSDKTEVRFFPSVNVVTGYPLTRSIGTEARAIIEPKVGVTIVPRKGGQSLLPNEDSEDVELDAFNLFDTTRLPGRDRVEDRSRTTVGVQTGLYGSGASQAEIFLGQSIRFDDDVGVFPNGSGIEDQRSDYVAQMNLALSDRVYMDYSAQFQADGFASSRHEVDLDWYVGRVDLGARYFFARGLQGTDLSESREQIEGTAVYHMNDHWRARLLTTHDLGGTQSGLRRAAVGVDYFDDCFKVSSTVRRSLTRDETGESGTEFMVGIGFKNLGEAETGAQDLKAFADQRRSARGLENW